MRARLAILFRCPLWAVGKMVPASELAQWREIFKRMPWGFEAQDYLHSRTAINIMKTNVQLPDGTTDAELTLKDPYHDGSLTLEEFKQLDDSELRHYLTYAEITTEQYNSLAPEYQDIWKQRMRERVRAARQTDG